MKVQNNRFILINFETENIPASLICVFLFFCSNSISYVLLVILCELHHGGNETIYFGNTETYIYTCIYLSKKYTFLNFGPFKCNFCLLVFYAPVRPQQSNN